MKIHTLLNAIITLGWVVCIPLLCVAEVEEARDYKVGVILPLSGSLAFAGNEVRDSIELAASELSSSTTRFSFKFEDNGAGATATAAAANKFINVDHVDAVISLWPEAANVVAPISERKGVLHYTIAWDPNIA